MNEIRVAVAMSGGVDSSVAAALLKEQGCNVTGLTMRVWDGASESGGMLRAACYGPDEAGDIENARSVAEKIGIPHHVIDLTAEYRMNVLDYFSLEYLSGRTPNPCLMCNRHLKFKALLEKAGEIGIEFEYFATGHYCRVEYNKSDDICQLKKGKDNRKDQSYFLAFLSQAQLRRTLFPVGGLTKQEVRELARKFGLGLEEKPESQDFIAGGYRSLITDNRPGPIKSSRGEILGEHTGISGFTYGQRKGLGVSGSEPWYVTDIDPETGTITVGRKDEIYCDSLTASGMSWISGEKPEADFKVWAKIRYNHREAEAIITPLDDNRVHVRFREPQMAVTPGQAVVFYDGDTLLGGGIIERRKQ